LIRGEKGKIFSNVDRHLTDLFPHLLVDLSAVESLWTSDTCRRGLPQHPTSTKTGYINIVAVNSVEQSTKPAPVSHTPEVNSGSEIPRQILVGYGIDVDAVRGWINTQNGASADITNISRGVFGATVGTDRLLSLLDRYNIKASRYIPGRSIESFPKQMAKVRDAGHEM
jgi:Polysaccharide deacetylase